MRGKAREQDGTPTLSVTATGPSHQLGLLMIVTFVNDCDYAVSSFSVQWNGGESDRTRLLTPNGDSAFIDMSQTKAPTGESCWARAYVQMGPNHDSSQNFTVGDPDVTYTLTGTVDKPSFDMS